MSPSSPSESATLSQTAQAVGFSAHQLPSWLSETNNPLLRVYRDLNDGVMVCNPEGDILWFNEPLRPMMELSDEVYQQWLNGHGTLADLPGLDTLPMLMESVFRNNKACSEEYKVRFSRGHSNIKKFFIVHGLTLDTHQAEFTQQSGLCLLIIRNITPIKNTEKMRRDFVANVSHELRTPLSVIKGYTETLLDGALQETEIAQDFLETIYKHAHRLSRLVEDLLDLSRLESMDYQLEATPVKLPRMVSRILNDLSSEAQKKNQTLLNQVSDDLPQALAHSPSIEQVLTNLLDNAIKYTPNGGTVTVKALDEDDMIHIMVRDTGVGIAAKHIPRLFERFYRADKARSREMGGTGLGLSIVKHIIQNHGGDVWVDSELNEGTTFHFTLRKAQPEDFQSPQVLLNNPIDANSTLEQSTAD